MTADSSKQPKRKQGRRKPENPPKEEQGYSYVDPVTGQHGMFHPEAEIKRYSQLAASVAGDGSEQWLREHPDQWVILYKEDSEPLAIVSRRLPFPELTVEFFTSMNKHMRTHGRRE